MAKTCTACGKVYEREHSCGDSPVTAELRDALAAEREGRQAERAALKWTLDAIEYGPLPEAPPGHSCGPEGGCDGDCADRAHYIDGLRKAYAAAGSVWPPKAEGRSHLDERVRTAFEIGVNMAISTGNEAVQLGVMPKRPTYEEFLKGVAERGGFDAVIAKRKEWSK